MEQNGQFDLALVWFGSDSVSEMHESHHEDVQEDACSSVSDRKLANGFSSTEGVISDQSKREVFVDGSVVAG